MLIDILILLLGLSVGSFLNVCIHRLPKEESIVRPRSHCPNCQQAVRWFDNIPVLSYLVLSGRCRDCRARISVRYPLVELASGIIWIASWKGSHGSLFFLVPVVFISLLLAITVTDFETGLIPDPFTYSGIGIGIAANFLQGGLPGAGKSILGLAVGGGIIYGTAFLGNLIFKKESMGGGDVKLLALIGSFLGWERAVFTFFTAPVIGLPIALYQKWVKKAETIPYGPFLAIAALIQFFYGGLFLRYFFLY